MADEKNNTGNLNTGTLNTGNLNAGNWNTGNWNAGDLNTGNLNAGNWNTGNLNAGNLNAGNWNTGNWNAGDLNTGNWNAGDLNTGNLNAGNWNTGNWNTGNWNAGDLNTGNWNTGYFCVNDGPVFFFDTPVLNMTREQAVEAIPYIYLPLSVEWVESAKMSDAEKQANPSHLTTGGFLRKYNRTIQETFPIEWAKQSLETKQRFLSLPHFHADKFLKCTGVDVRLDRDLFPQAESAKPVTKPAYQRIEIDGKSYNLVPV